MNNCCNKPYIIKRPLGRIIEGFLFNRKYFTLHQNVCLRCGKLWEIKKDQYL